MPSPIRIVSLITILLNVLVYFYPDILNSHDQCKWHQFDSSPKLSTDNVFLNSLPPTLLEKVLLNYPKFRKSSDSQSPRYSDGSIKDINMLTFGDPQINGNWPSTKYIKRLDNYGNDHYLGHIYKTMQSRLSPSHVAVMGDLFSSQWILDSEFYNRTYRFVERLFPRSLEYKKTVIDTWSKQENYDWPRWLNDENAMDPLHRFNSRVYDDVYDWVYQDHKYPNYKEPLFINLTGNHDIGYSGDATWQHMARFHHLFGQNNYVINYNLNTSEPWRLVVLDSLTLEGPALQEEFRTFTWQFLHYLKEKENPRFDGSTVLLTHIPLFKKEGLCKDGPQHIYYEDYEREPYKNGKLRSQNHLLNETSQAVLEAVFPNGDQNGIILTGHDHYGCDSWYNYHDGHWEAALEPEVAREPNSRKPIHEVVVRAMMGEFDGQTGLVTGHYNYDEKTWDFNFSYCSFMVQHVWWASKVSLIVMVIVESWVMLRQYLS